MTLGIDRASPAIKIRPFDAFPRIGHVPIDGTDFHRRFSGSPRGADADHGIGQLLPTQDHAQRAADQPDADNRHLFKMWCLHEVTATSPRLRRSSGLCGKGYSVRSTAACNLPQSLPSTLEFRWRNRLLPSHRAHSGLECTSISSPSAPAAIAAFDIGATKPICRLRGWDDDHRQMRKGLSARDGRKIQRVPILRFEGADAALHNSITFRLPRDMMYSADNRNSLIVAERPRFNKPGLSYRPRLP